MENSKAVIFDIERNSFVDGPGIRTTVFFKGCNSKCAWCHNPESQNPKKEIMFYRNKCTNCGRCRTLTVDDENFICFSDAKEICGKEYTVDEVFKEILKDKSFYEASDGGVTFSGGECMLQIDFLAKILKKCKNNGIHTAVDTAGNVSWDYFKKIKPYTDLFLYDVKCFSSHLHIAGTGASNDRILDNLKKLSHDFDGDIIIRIPVIIGFNDGMDEMQKIACFLKDIRVKGIELLPYHKMGEHKYNNGYAKSYMVPTDEQMKTYKELFSNQ